jgi:general secretion pathway protein G
MIRARPRPNGFTLIEMLIVVAIVGLLAGTAVGSYKRAVQRSREALLRENLYVMRSQISTYVAANGHYPFALETLVTEGYLREIPVDPITRSKDSWVTIQALPSDLDLTVEPGIEDVQSGADGYGMDGTAYADW